MLMIALVAPRIQSAIAALQKLFFLYLLNLVFKVTAALLQT